MAIKYTEEQLNSVDKSMLIQMFLNQQEQLEKVSADSFLIIKQIQAVYREEGKLKELSSKERLVQRQVVVKPLVSTTAMIVCPIPVARAAPITPIPIGPINR